MQAATNAVNEFRPEAFGENNTELMRQAAEKFAVFALRSLRDDTRRLGLEMAVAMVSFCNELDDTRNPLATPETTP